MSQKKTKKSWISAIAAVFVAMATVGLSVQPALAAKPNAPTNLSATAVSQTQINLSWTDNSSNESGFKIERSDNGVDFSQIGTNGMNNAYYYDWGLSAGTYYYRVRAYNNDGNSDYSNIDYDTVY